MERGELNADWNVDVWAGNYIAKVSLFYDGETKTFQKSFTIGDKKLEVKSIYVNDFRLGDIIKLHIIVENDWNEDLEGVFANLFVYNSRGNIMADVKSSSERVPKTEKKELIAYWDTAGVEEGEYDAKLRVVYDRGVADTDLRLKVGQNSLDIFGVGYAIRPEGDGGIDIVMILVALIIILLLMNFAWFVFLKRLHIKISNKKQIQAKKK